MLKALGKHLKKYLINIVKAKVNLNFQIINKIK